MYKIKLDFQQLRERCLAPQSDFFKEGDVFDLVPAVAGKEAWYIFKDNGAKILAVAHLDTVLTVDDNWTFQSARLGSNKQKLTYIWNAQLDDRLGAYIILDLLPSLMGGFKYDVLLTTNEETGASTARDFVPPEGKDYNWIFEFDRRGTGAVLYEYDDKAWRDTTGEYFKIQQGSYSDISKMQGLGIKAINIGTGYHDEHRDACHMIVEETKYQVNCFLGFFSEYADVKFPHTEKARSYSYTYTWKGRNWNGAWDDEDDYYGRWGDGTYRPSTNANVVLSAGTTSTKITTQTKALSNPTSKSASSIDPREWVTIPNVETFQQRMKGSDFKTTVYIHPTSGQMAVMCAVCGEAENIEDIIWSEEDSCPLCSWCASQAWAKGISPDLPSVEEIFLEANSPITDDQMDWLLDGGTVHLHGNHWVRAVPKKRPNQKDENLRKEVICDKCFQPDWLDSAFFEGKLDNQKGDVYFCRWCHDKYVVNMVEDEEDTRELHIKQDGMDDDDRDFYGNTRVDPSPVQGMIKRLTNNTLKGDSNNSVG